MDAKDRVLVLSAINITATIFAVVLACTVWHNAALLQARLDELQHIHADEMAQIQSRLNIVTLMHFMEEGGHNGEEAP